jgi:putative thiamine transport system permease protein
MFIRIAPTLTFMLLAAPVSAGLIGTILPAFGFMPALGRSSLSLEPWRDLLATPGLGSSVIVCLFVGFATTAISLLLVVLIAAAFHGRPTFCLIRRCLSPILAVPHFAVAIGLAFVIAPSGLMFRLWSTYLGGPPRPPDILIVNDSWGLALIAGLIVKEVPFLFLMLLSALPQADADRSLAIARTLGYRPVAAWLKVVLPRVYPQIRLPVLAVLVYGISVVDVAMVLGPNTPATLPVQILRWMNDPDLTLRFRASAGALLLLVLVFGSIALWLGAEALTTQFARRWVNAGGRQAFETGSAIFATILGSTILAFAMLAIASIFLWSIAEVWRYPHPLPSVFTLANWERSGTQAFELIANSVIIAIVTALISVILVVAILEKEARCGRSTIELTALWLLYLPLLAPQISYLQGLHILIIQLNLDEMVAAVILAHIVFVLPYVLLSLADPWRAFDGRYRKVALSLGSTPTRFLFKVKLPMLLRALLAAFAVAIAVSMGQYLPTLLVAGARWPTITTEAVSISSGGDRRILAVYAVLQMLVPFVAFLMAMVLPSILFRNRKGMAGQ